MKKQLLKTTWRPSILSLLTLGIFVLLALGSILGDFLDFNIKFLGNGVFEELKYYGAGRYTTTTGNRDEEGRWQGPVKIENIFSEKSSEEVTMVNGLRHGTSKMTSYGYPTKHVWTKCYNLGVVIPCGKSAGTDQADKSAYRILGDKYSWYFFSLYCHGFDSTYIESYLDTLEILLYSYEFEELEFDSYYEDILDVLEETPYDSITSLQGTMFLFKGFEEMKNAVLRLAVIDHYRSAGVPTYDIVTTTYPSYLHTLNDSGVVDQDFEQFCTDLDDSLASYGPLDPIDPFYVDSIDSYLFRALSGIMNTELKSTRSPEAGLSLTNHLFTRKEKGLENITRHYTTILKTMLSPAGSSDVAEVMISEMLTLFIKGDIIRSAVREAYNLRKGIVSLPVVTTEFMGNTSATSVTLQGYVIEDGGAAVTVRGIAWAGTYNPTIEDHTLASGSGTGSFPLSVEGLTEGSTYYARTYATNSAGTAYGNCIEFVAGAPSGIQDKNLPASDFNVYPNPSKASATFSFCLGSPESMVLTIIDMKGQQVFYRDLGLLPQGESRITMDLSGLQNGIYNCQLTNGTGHVVRKLEIVR